MFGKRPGRVGRVGLLGKRGVTGGLAGPTQVFDFLASGSSGPAGVSVTRAAGGATYFDNTNTLQFAALNSMRIDYGPTSATPIGMLVESSRTNGIINPRAEGSVNGTPGTLPTNWTQANPQLGLSSQVVGTGTEQGIPYIDYRLFGTATGAGSPGLFLEGATVIADATGQVWSTSAYVKLAAGSLSNVTNVAVGARANDVSGVQLVFHQVTATPSGASLGSQRVVDQQWQNINASIAFIQPYVVVTVTGAGAVDVTLRIGGGQCELGSCVTSLILPPGGTPAATTRAADAAIASSFAWWNTTSGSLVDEINTPLAFNSHVGICVDDGTNSNRFGLYRLSSGNNITVLTQSTGASTTVTAGTLTGTPVIYKAGMTMAVGQITSAVNGVGGASNAVNVPSPALMTKLLFGSFEANVGILDGWVRRVRYWPRVLSAGELVTQTT